MAAPEEALSVAVVGLPLVVVTLTFLFMALGVVAVTVRTWIRLRLKSFGMDDAMVVFTLVSPRTPPPPPQNPLCRTQEPFSSRFLKRAISYKALSG